MKLYRCRWDKKIAGICGGLGQYFKIDPTLLRLALVVLVFLTGFLPVIAIYLIAWALIPIGPPHYVEIPCKKLYKSRYDRKISGVCGGLAEYFKINSTLVRLSVVILAFVTFLIPIVIGYIAGSILIPENPDQL